jgi:hypothetical protein
MQFAQNQASLDGLTQTNIVGDEKARAGQGKSHLDGNKLVVFMTNGRAEGRALSSLDRSQRFQGAWLGERGGKGISAPFALRKAV